ncbi:MAG: alpha/beta hydrolase family protein [Myxococcales bacterium]|nr:alpha/beta hydrolase family protein [Myxococcales bacterium]
MHWLDALYLKLTARQPLFLRGWGDIERPLDEVPALLTRSVPPPLSLEFLPTSPRIDEAFVTSPAPLLDVQMAPLHVVRLRAKGPTRARLIVPPSWGDEGFWLRRHLVDALRYRGVEVWLFEGAYFGSRRAAGQVKVGLHTVGDFLRMGLANVHETRALVATALELEPRLPVLLAGYSMAGQMSAHAAASLDLEVPVTLMAPPENASVVFCSGPLSKSVSWSALGDDAVSRLAGVLRQLSVLSQPPPRSRHRVVVATRRDGIVPPASMLALATHWGVTPTWVDSGHLGAYALRASTLRAAMLDTLDAADTHRSEGSGPQLAVK